MLTKDGTRHPEQTSAALGKVAPAGRPHRAGLMLLLHTDTLNTFGPSQEILLLTDTVWKSKSSHWGRGWGWMTTAKLWRTRREFGARLPQWKSGSCMVAGAQPSAGQRLHFCGMGRQAASVPGNTRLLARVTKEPQHSAEKGHTTPLNLRHLPTGLPACKAARHKERATL